MNAPEENVLEKYYPLLEALEQHDINGIKHFLLHSRDRLTWLTTFLESAKKGYLDIIIFILENNKDNYSTFIDINDKDINALNALVYACQNGHFDIVQILVINGANVNHNVERGKTEDLSEIKGSILLPSRPFFPISPLLSPLGLSTPATLAALPTPIIPPPRSVLSSTAVLAARPILIPAMSTPMIPARPTLIPAMPTLIPAMPTLIPAMPTLIPAMPTTAVLAARPTLPALSPAIPKEKLFILHNSTLTFTSNIRGNREVTLTIFEGPITSPLNAACRNGHFKIVEYLLFNKAKINGYSNNDTPLTSTISGGYLKIIKMLVDLGADLHSKIGYLFSEYQPQMISPFSVAVMNGRKDIVEYLFPLIDEFDKNLIAYTVYIVNNEEILLFLLVNRLFIDEYGEIKELYPINIILYDETPLAITVRKCFYQQAKILLDYGASLHLPRVIHHCYLITVLLIMRNVIIPDFNERFHIPDERISNLYEILSKNPFESHKSNPEISNFMYAALNGYASFLSYILSKILSLTDDRSSEAVISFRSERKEGQELRLKLITQEDSNGNTALHYAVQSDNPIVILILLGSGADILKKNKMDDTPLDILLERWNDIEITPYFTPLLLKLLKLNLVTSEYVEDLIPDLYTNLYWRKVKRYIISKELKQVEDIVPEMMFHPESTWLKEYRQGPLFGEPETVENLAKYKRQYYQMCSNPDVTREDIRRILVDEFGLENDKLTGKTKAELCQILFNYLKLT